MGWLVATMVAGLVGMGAQHGVDFSGRWVLTSSDAGPATPRVLVVEQPITRTTVRGASMPPAYLRISIRREGAAGVSTETRLIGSRSGTFSGTARGITRRTSTQTTWAGETLVFEDGSSTGDPPRTGDWAERREAWSLAPDGTLAIEITTESSTSARQMVRLDYARQ